MGCYPRTIHILFSLRANHDHNGSNVYKYESRIAVNELSPNVKSRSITTCHLTTGFLPHSFNSVLYIAPTAYTPSPTMSTEKHSITLYCEGTPNPLKISIALEELGLKYNVRSPHRSRSPLRNKKE